MCWKDRLGNLLPDGCARAPSQRGPGYHARRPRLPTRGCRGPLALEGLSVQGPPRSRNAPETDGEGLTAEVCPDGTRHQTLS